VVLSYCNDITAASSGASSDTCHRALATLCHLVLSKVKDTIVFDNADDNSQATQQAYELYFLPTTTGWVLAVCCYGNCLLFPLVFALTLTLCLRIVGVTVAILRCGCWNE
jgi:hypothetical protein